MRPGEVQTLRRFLFHACAESVAFHIVSGQRTNKDREANAKCDHEENRTAGSKDQQFPSQRCNGRRLQHEMARPREMQALFPRSRFAHRNKS